MNGEGPRAKGFIEYILWKFLAKTKETSKEDAHVYVYGKRTEEPIFSDSEINGEVKDISEVIIDLDDDVDVVPTDDYLELEEINKLQEETQAQGIMLFYGDSPLVKAVSNTSKEVLYKPKLLMNLLLGLSVLSHQGNMVLRLYEVGSKFTISLIFLCYLLFDSVSVVRPPFSNPSSNS